MNNGFLVSYILENDTDTNQYNRHIWLSEKYDFDRWLLANDNKLFRYTIRYADDTVLEIRKRNS